MPPHSSRIHPLIVRSQYVEKEYRDFLRASFKISYDNDKRGRSPYYFNEIKPAVEGAIGKVHYESGEVFAPNFDQIESDLKRITEILRPDYSERSSDAALFPVIDVFMQLEIPGFDSAFRNKQNLDALGSELGSFLKDASSQKNLLRQALNVQKIIGIYEYEEVDTHLEENGERRVITFLSGKSNDYLKVVDFIFDPTENAKISSIKNINPICGFCIPGEEFSPVLTRSPTYKTRHLGLLYTRGSLVEMTGGPLDDLTYESFTTNKSQLGSTAKSEESAGSLLFAQALDLHYGPRLRRDLTPVTNPREKAKITEIVARISLDML